MIRILKKRRTLEEAIEKTLERVPEHLAYRIRRISSPLPDDIEIIAKYQAGYSNLATVIIYREVETDRYVYHIEEPPVSPIVENLYHLVRERFQSMEMHLPEKLTERELAYERYIMEALKYLGYEEAYYKYPELRYYLIRDLVGWGVIDVPMRDPYVEEIDYSNPTSNASVVLNRDDVEAQWVDTNISLTEDEIVKVIEMLAFKTGRQISVAQPLMEARSPEGYRIAANLKEVGLSPAFTIRKHPETPRSITYLIYNRTLSPLMAAYFWILIEARKFIMIIGAMASGKTTMLQALLSLVPRDFKITTIEDTPELKLAHPRWQALYSRRSVYGTEQDVTLFDLARYSLRTRAQFIVIGEVRDREINTLVQMAASGHGSACTFHAEDPETLFLRLTSPPLEVQPSFLLTITAIVLQQHVWSPLHKKFVRRTAKVWEVVGIKKTVKEGEIPVEFKEVFAWDPMEDYHYPDTPEDLVRESKQLRIVGFSKYGDRWRDLIVWELEERAKFLEQLVREGVFDYREVTERIYRKSIEIKRKLAQIMKR